MAGGGKCGCHDWSASRMKRHLHWRGARGINFQPHQILRLPRKMNLMIDPHHIWNVTYNARSNRHHPPTSPNTAPATQNEISWLMHRTYENVIYNARSNSQDPPTSPNTAPATQTESHDWCTSHLKRHLRCAEQQSTPANLTKYRACHAKWISWLMHITFETSFTMRGATGINFQPHQILRQPRQRSVMIHLHYIWNVIFNARSNRHHPPTSPNTAPATPKECHDSSALHMKRHLQCAEQQASPSNLTKYCACHAKLHSQILEKFAENRWSGISNARPIRAWSEHDPSISDHDPTQETQNWTRRAAKATFRTRQEQILLKITTFPAPAIIPKFTTCCACHEKWHMNFTKCCACQEKWHMNFTKCCACHEKWHEVTHDYYYYYYY